MEMRCRGKGRDCKATGRCGGREGWEAAGRAGLGLARILRMYLQYIFNFRTGQRVIQTVLQTDDFFDFISQAKPDGSAIII